MPNFLFLKEEINHLMKKLDILENKMNSLDILNDPIELYLNRDKKIGIFMIYFTISLIRSFIYTYNEMIKDNYLNYNIISNLRRINIVDNYDNLKIFLSNLIYNYDRLNINSNYTYFDENHIIFEKYNYISLAYKYFPFYNISMNKYFYENIPNQINNDDFIEGNNFQVSKNLSNNKNEYKELYKKFDMEKKEVIKLKNSNFFFILDLNNNDNNNRSIIIIKEYKINNENYEEFLDYQTIEINNNFEYNPRIILNETYQDQDGKNIYFIFSSTKSHDLIVITKFYDDKHKIYFKKKILIWMKLTIII